MPNLERAGFGPVGDTLQTLLTRLGIGGIVFPGSLNWNTYPAAAEGVSGTSGNGSYGTAVSAITTSDLTSQPYICTHVQMVSATAASYSIDNGSTVLREVQGNFNSNNMTPLYPIYALPSTAIRVAGKASGSTPSFTAYATALLTTPVRSPQFSREYTRTVAGGIYNANDFGNTTTSGSAWVYSAYRQIVASTASPILIYRVYSGYGGGTNASYQNAIATGAAASEVDWGVFASLGGGSAITDLRPFCMYIPAGTRLSYRSRGANTTVVSTCFLEYITLPMGL